MCNIVGKYFHGLRLLNVFRTELAKGLECGLSTQKFYIGNQALYLPSMHGRTEFVLVYSELVRQN